MKYIQESTLCLSYIFLMIIGFLTGNYELYYSIADIPLIIIIVIQRNNNLSKVIPVVSSSNVWQHTVPPTVKNPTDRPPL